MSKNIIQDKSFSFAVKIIDLYKSLIAKKEYILSKQLLKSGTSIGANIRESSHAESKRDFVHKLAVAQKEANESEYWIDLLFHTNYITAAVHKKLSSELIQIRRILTSIILTTKEKYLQ